MLSFVKKIFNSTLFFYCLILIALEFLINKNWIASSILPQPSSILKIYVQETSFIFSAAIKTLFFSITTFIVGSLIAIILAILAYNSPGLKKRLIPLAVFLQTVPIVALAPLLVIYFGFGSLTLFAAGFIVSFFPVFTSLLVGLNQTQHQLVELFQFYQASSFRQLISLRLPGAVSHLYSGLKASAGLSVIGVVAGEFVVGGGLGGLIDSARLQQRIDLVFACLILLSLNGLFLIKSTEYLFNLFLKPYFIKIDE